MLGQLCAASVLVKELPNTKYLYLLIYHMQHQGPRGQETMRSMHVLKIFGEHEVESKFIRMRHNM